MTQQHYTKRVPASVSLGVMTVMPRESGHWELLHQEGYTRTGINASDKTQVAVVLPDTECANNPSAYLQL